MREQRNTCPNCKEPAFPQWAFFVYWPFSTKCNNCGVRVRAKNPFWQNLLFQVLGQTVFWGGILFSITVGISNIIVGIIAGSILALLVLMVAGLFSKLEVIQNSERNTL
jgi:hypothetical protein